MGRDQNFCELSVNVISLFTIWAKREIDEWQVSLFVMILNDTLANVCIISLENAKITVIGRERDFTI